MKVQNRNKLRPYEQNLYTALYQDYSRNLPTAALNMMEQVMFDEAGWTQKTNLSCSHCVLRLLKAVAKLYFQTPENKLQEGDKTSK